MNIPPFKLERYFAKYEFSIKYLLGASDCESLKMSELLELSSPSMLHAWQELSLGYTESQGNPLLRDEISKLYNHISPQNILIAAPEEAIFIAMQSLLQAGDHVIAVAPAYQSLHEISRAMHCDLSTLNLELIDNKWVLPVDKLEGMIHSKTRLLIINFPNNPTGFLPTQKQFEEMISIAKKHGLYVFSDEMYRLLEFDPSVTLPSASDVYSKAVSLSGLSKTFSLPGLRIGWLTTRMDELIQKFIAFKDYTTICNSAPSEILAIIALQNKNKIISRNLDLIQKNLTFASQFFDGYPNLVEWITPMAGPIAFPRWAGTNNIEYICQMAAEQHGIMLVPGSMFDHHSSHFRIGMGRLNFQEALEHLAVYLSNIH